MEKEEFYTTAHGKLSGQISVRLCPVFKANCQRWTLLRISEPRITLCLDEACNDMNHLLYKSGFEHVKQLVSHRPGISLAKVPQTQHLTSKNKVVLACILVNSLCKLYASGWTDTEWNSQTVHLIEETRGHGQGVFAPKPYLCVHFNHKDPGLDECNNLEGGIHDDHRIQATPGLSA